MEDPYDAEKRYRIWEESYNSRVSFELRNRNFLSDYLDEVSVAFEDVKNKLRVLERQVSEYSGNHKTHLYFSIQESKNELDIQLDKIEINSQKDLREERRKLFHRLAALSGQLDSKLHSEPLDDDNHPRLCPDCVNRIIVVPQLIRM